jgi:uncharacterized membrane protein YphA (DoxX/SURF4 family)
VLDIALWIAQGFLALFFFAAGLPKVVGRGIDRWAGFDDLPRALTILIGVSEVAGAVALVLPPLIGTFEWMSPLAAIGIAVISLMASGFHIRAVGGEDRLREGLCAVETALWACLAGSIAIGRWGEMVNGPAIRSDILLVAIAVVIPAIIINLVLVTRRPVQPRNTDGPPQRVAVSG